MMNREYSWRLTSAPFLAFLITVSGIVFSSNTVSAPDGALGYRVIDLGTLGGSFSVAEDLNDHGQIVGQSTTDTGANHAFLYHDGAMTDLGTLPGGTDSEADAINDRGQVVGISEMNTMGHGFPEISQGFIWEGGNMRSVSALYCPCSYNVRYGTSAARGINDFSQVAGWSETVRGSWVLHILLWQGGTLQDLGGGAGDWSISHAFDINNIGQLVGDYSQDAGRLMTYEHHASLWSKGQRQDLGMLPGYTSSTALAINDREQIVGWSGTSDGTVSRAFRWEKGIMRDLGTLPGDTNSAAEAINIFGQAVGWSGVDKGADSHAVLWSRNRILNLNQLLPSDSGWVLTDATAINALGQIAGTGRHNGQPRAFLLQPRYRSWPR
ncbi:MAG: hypothetical protein ACRETO_00890 [Gammaproteobacteria bacterium]